MERGRRLFEASRAGERFHRSNETGICREIDPIRKHVEDTHVKLVRQQMVCSVSEHDAAEASADVQQRESLDSRQR
jgi:hypothetical protein